MVDCPECYSKVGSLTKHRKVCPVRNSQILALGLESIEFWETRMESHLNRAYKGIARYTHLGKRDFDRQEAKEEHESAAGMVSRLPKLLEKIQGYPCERVSAVQLRASILSKQVLEIGQILRHL